MNEDKSSDDFLDDSDRSLKIKTEMVGCYVTEKDKETIQDMTNILYFLGEIKTCTISETMRIGIILTYDYVQKQLRQKLDDEIERLAKLVVLQQEQLAENESENE